MDGAGHSRRRRFSGRAAIPLALLAQGTGTTAADAGCIHDAQASVGFSASLMGHQRLASRTAERSVGLESKVLPREATCFPGLAYHCRSVPLNRRSLHRSFLESRRESRSKLGRAHRIRMELMTQFQTQIPHPLADQLSDLLTRGRMTDPAIGVLFLVFIS
jgi:hypothetical protein